MVQSLVVYGPILEVYSFVTDFGGGVILAPCLQQFCAEVRIACLMGLLSVTNLGEIGNLAHQLEELSSDHNPWVRMLVGAASFLLVRALDFGGRDWPLLLEFWNWRYEQRDPRVYYFGYTNSNLSGKYTGLTIWGGDGSTRPGTDGPHAHLSVTCGDGFNKQFGTHNYVAALNDRSSFGLVPWLLWKRGHADTPFGTSNPTSPIQVEDITLWEDLVDFDLKPGEDRLVSTPLGADYVKIDSYPALGEVQVQGFPPGKANGVLLGSNRRPNGSTPIRPEGGVIWRGADFSAAKYPKAWFRNTGPSRISVTIGQDA